MDNANTIDVKSTIVEWALKTGGLGVAVAVLVWFHQDFTTMHMATVDQHRQERREWKKDIKEINKEWIEAVDDLKEAIDRKNTP